MSERDRIDEAFEAYWRLDKQGRQRTTGGHFHASAREAFRAGWLACRAEAVKEEALGDYRINGKLTTLRDRLSRLGTEREEGLGQ